MLEDGAAECHGNGNTQELIGLRLDIPVEGARPTDRWPFRSPSELLQLFARLLPEHAHQGQDEVRLVKRDSFGVDAHENLGDMLFLYGRIQLDDLERVRSQVAHAIELIVKLPAQLRSQRPACRLQPVKIAVNRGPVVLPQRCHVGQELGILLDGRVGHLEAGIVRTERDPDTGLAVILPDHLVGGKHRVDARQPLLPIYDQPTRNGLVLITDPDGTSADFGSRHPEKQIADGEAAQHRVQQVPDLPVRPYKGTLELWQRDITALDVFHKMIKLEPAGPKQRA